jgi:hypothetical protein
VRFAYVTRFGVIPSGAVFQAKRGISRAVKLLRARPLGPLEHVRAFGMTLFSDVWLELNY